MQNQNMYNWTVKSGDYQNRSGDYDKLYRKGIKRDKIMRALIWVGVGLLTYIVFFEVLAYAAAR